MIDFATVVFQEELELLKVQAKSINLYCKQEPIDNIFVIINDTKDICDRVNLSWYRDLASKVRVLHCSELTNVTYDMHGWDSQQLLKLLISVKSLSKYCFVLDAKTWFVKDSMHSLLSTKDLANCVLMKMFDHFAQSAVFLSKYFDNDINHIIGPGGVPFAFHTDTVRSLVSYIEHRENKNFDEWFKEKVQYPSSITEFTLYSAYIQTNDLFQTIYSTKSNYNVINVADFQMNQIDQLMKEMHSKNTLTTSLHRNVYKFLSESQFYNWCKFLSEKNLYVSPEIAKMQLNTFRSGVHNDTGIRL